MGISNNLIALVTFQTFVNLIGIVLFYPFLNIFSRFLEKRYMNDNQETFFINKTSLSDTDIAFEAMKEETKIFLYQVIGYSLETFGISNKNWQKPALSAFSKQTNSDKYDHIKRVYGDIHAYSIELQSKTDTNLLSQEIEKLTFSVRNGMYAAKNIKDIIHDIEQLSNSSNDVKYSFYIASRKKTQLFFDKALSTLDSGNNGHFEELTKLYNDIQENYTTTLKGLYDSSFSHKLSDIEISTILNFNRELYSAFKSVVMALKDYSLNEEQAAYFDGLKGFIR
jgi:phosphate:Na+ symporter